MTTGQHTVRDICCTVCETKVGWKYVSGAWEGKSGPPRPFTIRVLTGVLLQIKATEPSQKYKIGHYIVERALITDVERTVVNRNVT